jgi:hypothetical protein
LYPFGSFAGCMSRRFGGFFFLGGRGLAIIDALAVVDRVRLRALARTAVR